MEKDKQIGLVLLISSATILTVAVFSKNPYAIVPAIVVSLPLLEISYKLLRYPSPIPVTIEKVAKSVKPKLVISFSGIDGSGKSTHAETLKERFRELGIPCIHVMTRWRPIITYPIMGMIYILTGYRRKDYHKNKVLRRIWAYLTILDFVYLFIFKIRIHLLRRGIVICDRYIYDHIADLMHDGLYNERAVKILLKLFKPDLAFIFDIPVEVSLSRKNNTQDALKLWKFEEDVVEYLSIQRRNYLALGEKLRITVINSIEDFDKINEHIFKEIIKVAAQQSRIS